MLKTALSEVVWLAEARKHIGLKEIKGSQHTPELCRYISAQLYSTVNKGLQQYGLYGRLRQT